ncbi:glycosyltransferase, partial [Prosthecochloris vibrioformis]
MVRTNIELCRKRLDLPIKLSVVVPVFNTGKYLEQCLQSILNQTEASLEVIVINDGSSDNSLDIIQRTMLQDKRVVLITNNNPSGNPGTPRNQGIAIAKGKYLGFVDSDDWIDPDYIKLIDLNTYDLVVEFGSGISTVVMAKALLQQAEKRQQTAAKLVSFEHLDDYYKKTAEQLANAGLDNAVQLELTPLAPYKAPDNTTYSYYDCRGILKKLGAEFTGVYPEAEHQRCWVHKTANVLDKLPKSVQPSAKSLIHDI